MRQPGTAVVFPTHLLPGDVIIVAGSNSYDYVLTIQSEFICPSYSDLYNHAVTSHDRGDDAIVVHIRHKVN
jgi:hypothetical protein